MNTPVEAAVASGTDDVWLLRLYIAGQSPRSLAALSNLYGFCELHLSGRYEIETVDLVQHPERAADDDILAIPTLVRRQPQPTRTIIGDLSEPESLRTSLQLRPLVA